LYGTDIVEISVNGLVQFQINIDNSCVTIDSLEEDAYKDNKSNLKNRQMTGKFPNLMIG
jgi:hypothetical protein